MRVLWTLVMCCSILGAGTPAQDPALRNPRPADRDAQFQAMLARAIRHELITLPYYDVFDWLEATALPNGKVTLSGQVVRPTTKSEAEKRIRRIESVTEVTNDIRVLPVSPNDDRLRVATYRAIFAFNSPLFRYSMRAVPPIHIIIENGRATLKGVVASRADSQLAETAARNVPGLFEVKNELRIEQESEK